MEAGHKSTHPVKPESDQSVLRAMLAKMMPQVPAIAAIERECDANPPPYDGVLPKLYERVQKHLNLIV